MRKIFSTDTPIFQFLFKLSSMLWMNVLWLLCCLPIVTAGASTAAFFRMMLALRDDGIANARSFFKCFKENLVKGSCIGLALLALAALLYIAYGFICLIEDEKLRLIALLPCLFGMLLWGVECVYAMPLTAYFENSVGNTMKNALLMGLKHYRTTVYCCVLELIPVLIILITPYWFLRLLPLWLFVLPAIQLYFVSEMLRKVFRQYEPKNVKKRSDAEMSVQD